MCCPPSPPDPYATAAAQTQANKEAVLESAKVNQVNEVNPYGSRTWTGEIGSPDRTVTTNLSPAEQAKYDLANSAIMGAGSHVQNRLNQITDTPFSLTGYPERQYGGQVYTYDQGGPLASGIADAGPLQRQVADAGSIQRSLDGAGPVARTFGDAGQIQSSVGGADAATRNSVEDALYQRQTARLDPQFQRGQSDLETRLANQGITQGSDAYDREMNNFNQNKNDAYAAARNDAIAGGGAEQSRLFGLGLDQGNFANQAQAQNFGQNLSRGNFYNTGQAQQFGQGATQGQFTNQAQAQQYGQNLSSMDAANQAQGQQFGQNAARSQFQNDTAMLADQRGMNKANFYNNALTTAQNSVNAGRDALINEQLLMRQQPLNEIAQLLSGAQANMPQFGGIAQYNQQAAPIGDYIQQNYAQQAQSAGGLMGGLFGLGGSLGSAKILSGAFR